MSCKLKAPEAEPLHPQCCCREVPVPYSNGDNPPLAPKHKLSLPMLFIPRPFPPPTLVDVPLEYIIDQLHNLAPQYWNRPETADCTIIVPVPYPRGCLSPMQASTYPPFSPETLSPVTSCQDPAGLGRRVTEPSIHRIPQISLMLHMDYLSAQSTFLRGLFSGASPLDLINSTPNYPPAFNVPNHTPSGRFTVPANRLPRLLPSPATHPVVFLPVPDPMSFHLLIHWIYFGQTEYIEEYLDKDIIQLEGIARNVDYLGLPVDLKLFLGKWLEDRRHPAPTPCYGNGVNDDYDSDTDIDDYDDYSDYEEQGNYDEAVPRGRIRTARPLTPHRHRSA